MEAVEKLTITEAKIKFGIVKSKKESQKPEAEPASEPASNAEPNENEPEAESVSEPEVKPAKEVDSISRAFAGLVQRIESTDANSIPDAESEQVSALIARAIVGLVSLQTNLKGRQFNVAA